MHYKNYRKAQIGDKVIGLTYNKQGVQVGVVKSITPDAQTCNVVLELPTKTPFHNFEVEYSQCDWLLHVDDVWSFVIGVAYSPCDMDYFSKVQNFRNKLNAPIEELPPEQRGRK